MPKSTMKALEEDPMGHLSHRMQSPKLLEEGTLPVPKSAKVTWDRSLIQQRLATRKTPRASPRKATPASPERDTIARPQKVIPVETLGYSSTSKQGHPIHSKGHPSCTLGHPCVHTPVSPGHGPYITPTSPQKGIQQSDSHCPVVNSRPLEEGTLPVPQVCQGGLCLTTKSPMQRHPAIWSPQQTSEPEAPGGGYAASTCKGGLCPNQPARPAREQPDMVTQTSTPGDLAGPRPL